MNVEKIVNRAIQPVNRNRHFFYFKNDGQKTTEAGDTVPNYVGAFDVTAQVQQEKESANRHSDGLTTSEVTRKIWLSAFECPGTLPTATWRPASRSGDLIVDDHGNVWKVTAVLEDYAPEGWISVRATMTAIVPDAVRTFARRVSDDC